MDSFELSFGSKEDLEDTASGSKQYVTGRHAEDEQN